MTAPITINTANFIKSPLNYTGGKHKLLSQIIPFFPNKIETFVDIFAGGFNVGINVNANKIIANDQCKPMIDLFEFFRTKSSIKIIEELDSLIDGYGLTNTGLHGYSKYNASASDGVSSLNKQPYLQLRSDYNRTKDTLLFYLAVIYAFNNQIRFNNKGEFNLPVNKRDFTSKMRKNLLEFVDAIHTKNIAFHSLDYREVPIPKSSFLYLDPPYLASLASYNENNGWNETKEKDLLLFIDSLHEHGHKFALSNVLSNKGKSNQLLIEWSKKYNINFLNHSYHNSNYQIKDKSKSSTIEVLITNY